MVLEILAYAFVTILILVLGTIYFKLVYSEKKMYDTFRAQGIPGEPFVPIIGQLSKLRKDREMDTQMSYLQELKEKYGNTFLFGFGPLSRIVVSEPDLLADILGRSNAHNYAKPAAFNAVFIPLVGRHNLLVAEGAEHERARRMINPAFYHTNLKSMISIMSGETAKAIEAMLSKYDSNSEKENSIDLQIEFNALTLSIIASSAFGSGSETVSSAKDIICRIFVESLDAVVYRSMRMVNQIPFLSRLPFWKKDVLDRGARIAGELIDRIIADRREDRSSSMCSGADLLDLLLSATDDQGQPFTDQEIKEESLTFVAAGSETTGNLMVWLMYVLMTHDDVLQACREEVDRVLPNGTELTNEHLSELVICEAVINETLRLYPPVPFFARESINEHTIGTQHQLRVPKGASFIVMNYILHRRADLWPRPLEFDYTRWMRDSKTGLKPKLPHPFAFLPFAAGPRNCIGQNFALLEARIMLAIFLQRCNFKIIPGQKIVPDVRITMRSKYGLLANVSKRQ